MKSKGHILLENSPDHPQLISKHPLGGLVQPVLSHPNYTDFFFFKNFFWSTNKLCNNVLNVLMKLRAISPNYLANHSIKQEKKKRGKEKKGVRFVGIRR